MNNKRFRSILCLLLTVIMTGSLLNFALPVEAEAAETAKASDMTWYWPINGYPTPEGAYCKITCSYGKRLKSDGTKYGASDYHYGVDIQSTYGNNVYPIQTGKVTSVHTGNDGGAGRYVVIDHGNGYKSKYFHLSAVSVKKGATVGLNTVIGKVGGSGNGDDHEYDSHLHLQIEYNGTSINPCPAGYTRCGGLFSMGNPYNYPMEDGKDTKGTRFSLSNPRISYETVRPKDVSGKDSYDTYLNLTLGTGRTIRKDASDSSGSVGSLKKGATVTATKIVKGTNECYWYYVQSGGLTGYVKAGDKDTYSIPDDILSLTGYKDIKTVKQETGHDIVGTVKSKNVKISSVTGRVYASAEDTYKESKCATPNAMSLDLKSSSINSGIRFSKISIGPCWLVLNATADCYFATSESKIERVIANKCLMRDDFEITGNLSTWTVTFDANGGSCDIQTVKVRKTTKGPGRELSTGLTAHETEPGSGIYTSELPLAKKPGYEFLGWYTGKTDGEKISTTTRVKGNVTYYAHWNKVAKTYTVTFDANGGSKTDPRVIVEGEAIGELPKPTRNGYAFQGWYTAASGGNKISSQTIVNKNVTYYAQWKKVYTVTFTANGGSGAPRSQSKTEGKALTLSKTIPTRSGYTFDHWCKNPDAFLHAAVKKYQPGGQYTKDEDVTLYAHWKKAKVKTYTVSFEPNIGKEGGFCKNHNYMEGESLGELPVLTYSGYSFQGWYTAASGGTKVNSDTKVTKDTTLYGHWTKTAVKTYEVDFNYNMGGAGGECRQYKDGQLLGTLPTPTRSGYSLVGWYTAASGGSQINSSTKVTGNVTYYAHWKQQADYLTSCTRYPSYGRVSVKTADYIYSLPCDSSTDSRSVKGTKQSAGAWLSVDGLYKNSKGQYWYSVELPSGAGYISAASTTSYQCMPLLKDVTIENAALPKNHIQGKSYSIGGTIRAGHLYLNEVAGSIQDSYNHSSTKTLRYSNDQQCTSLNLKSSAINTALKFGSLKAGNCLYVITVSADYYYSADGKTLSFWRQTEDLIWHEFKVVAKGKDVRFLSEGKEIYSTTVTESDNYLTMQSKPYDKPGHTFKGWYAYRDSDETWYTNKGWQTQSSIDKNKYTKKIYSAGSKYNLYHSSWGDSDFTFYAVWEYTGSGKDARFVSDGTVISSFHATPGNNMLTIAAAPAGKPGYTFRGWNVQRDADGTWYVDGRGWNTEASITANKYTKKLYAPGTKVDLYDSTWVDEASVTFYALWKAPDTYAVTYDANGGTGAPEGQQKIAGIDLTLSDTIPSRPGCQFLGWAADSGATAPEYQPGDSYTADAAVTLYAVWQVQTGLQVPDVTGMYVREAQLLLRMSGFVPQYDFTGWDDYRYIAAQTPAAGAFETAGGTVTLTTTSTAPASVPRLMNRYPIDDASVHSWEEQGRCILGVNDKTTLFKFETGSDWWPAIPYTTEKLCQVELSFTGDLPKNAYTICILTEGGNYYELPFGTDYFGNPGTVLAYMNKGSFNVVVMELDVPTGEWYNEYCHVQLNVTGSGQYNLTIQPDQQPDVQPDEGELVPDVTGMYVREAQLLLRMSGFVPQYDFTEWDDYRYIAAQTPAAGTFETAGGTVTLTTTSTAPASVPRLMNRYPIDDASVRSWEEQGRFILGVNDKKTLWKFESGSEWLGCTTPYTTEKLCQVELSFTGDLPKNAYTIYILTEWGNYLLPFGTDYFGNPGTVLAYMNKGSYTVGVMELDVPTGEWYEYCHVQLNVTGSGQYNLTIQPETQKAVPDVVGMRFDEACTLLKEAGFAVDETAYSADAVVDGQIPAAGTLVEPGSTVTLSCGNAGRSATSAYRYAVIDPETGAGLAWLDDDHLQPDTVEKDALSQTLNEVKLHITGSGYQGYPMKITPGGHLSPEYGQELAPDGNGDISIGAAPQSYTLWIEAAEGKFLCFPFTVSGDGTIDIDLTRKINVSYYNEDGSLYRTDEIDTSSVSAEISVGSYDQVKDGYTFAGWSVNGGTPNLPSSSVFTAFDISFTAVWTENAPDEEPVGENDAPKMYGAPEPVADPEPSTALEPTPDPEPSTAPEPTPDPEPSTAPEPSPNLEPAAEASE